MAASPDDGSTSIEGSGPCDPERESIYAMQSLSFEYFGPRCFLSFCSRPGIDWVISKSRSTGFRAIAACIIASVTQMMKINGNVATERATELPPETAWLYTKAYFADAPEAAFGVVERSWFETRLRSHFANAKPDDRVWYALRNVVWATGCRIELSKTTNFSQSTRAAWILFENALSVQGELLCLSTSIIAVQALILMAYFCESVSPPSLQYMLCSSALRLACSKGLHRQPAASWNLTSIEIDHRCWMFWAIYCLEKQIAYRGGRPSSIDDDEISCRVPDAAPGRGIASTTYCHILIRMMKLSSSTMKQLASARALHQSTDELVRIISGLDHQLRELKSSLKHIVSFTGALDLSDLPSDVTLRQALSIQHNYFALVFNIHTPLANPWSRPFIMEQNADSFAQYRMSCESVAEASRATILSTRHIQVNAYCPSLLLYSPLCGVMNLFIHILRDAGSPTTQLDLALMDVAVGYFSNLEFYTNSQVSMPFVRELSHYVRATFDQEILGEHAAVEPHNHEMPSVRQTLCDVPRPDNLLADDTAAICQNENIVTESRNDGDVEMWSTLLQFNNENDEFVAEFGELGDLFSHETHNGIPIYTMNCERDSNSSI